MIQGFGMSGLPVKKFCSQGSGSMFISQVDRNPCIMIIGRVHTYRQQKRHHSGINWGKGKKRESASAAPEAVCAATVVAVPRHLGRTCLKCCKRSLSD